MHVLIIPSWYPSHARDLKGSFFREQAIALRKCGCKVGVIYPALRSLRQWREILEGPGGFAAECDEGVMTQRYFGVNWSSRYDIPASAHFMLRASQLYQRYVAANGVPDVIHAHSLLYGGCAAARIFRKYGVPYVVTEHRSVFPAGTVSAAGMRLARDAARDAARGVAVSGALSILMDRCAPIPGQSWKDVPNIVNAAFTEYSLEPAQRRAGLEFLNVAVMESHKGQDRLIRAFARISAIHPSARLTIIGDGPERARLGNLVRELGLSTKVSFPGFLPRVDVMKRMAAADVFVLPSQVETFGVVVIEALALGKPVIATRCGGPDNVVRKKDGVLVSVDSLDELAGAMDRLTRTVASYDRNEIRRSCVERFGERAVAARIISIYDEVAGSAGRSTKVTEKAILPCDA